MRCPYCKADNDRVIDSRASADGFAIRRRRACRECGRRYTTYERVEGAPLRVVKKNGERVEFDRQKILAGMTRACEKRPVTARQLEAVVDAVERQCMEAFDKEVSTKVIGELIMQQLRQLDQVAYVRFASVYRAFKDVSQFLEELKPMLENRGRADGKPVVSASEDAPPEMRPGGSSAAAYESAPWVVGERGGIHEETRRVPRPKT